MPLTSRAFRAQLSEELPKWADEGLVSPETADLLRQRYRLDEDGTPFAALAVYMLGALLVAGGVISFIAWNWAYLPDIMKLAGGAALMIACQVAGYVLWRVDGRRPALGHGLVFLGLLLFGANLGLFAQIYNVHDHWSAGMGAWGTAALALALATGSRPCAAAAAVLSVVWGVGYTDAHPATTPFVAYGVSATIAALAYRLQHPVIAGLAATGTVVLITVGGVNVTSPYLTFFSPLAGAAAMVAISLHEGWWASTLRRLGLGLFIVIAFLASFGNIAHELAFAATAAPNPLKSGLYTLPLLGLAAGATLYRIARPRPLSPSEWTAVAALGAALLLFVIAASSASVVIAVAAHAGLIALVTLLIRRAIDELERGPFWLGVIVGGVLIMARFLEFETGLLIKALVFTALGITVLVIGYAFESRRREVHHAS